MRRISAGPGSQGARADLVEARGSDPCRILLRQRTLLVRPFHAFPHPGKFSLESFPWNVFPGKFSLESFPLKNLTHFVAGQNRAPGLPKLRNKERS